MTRRILLRLGVEPALVPASFRAVVHLAARAYEAGVAVAEERRVHRVVAAVKAEFRDEMEPAQRDRVTGGVARPFRLSPWLGL